jgi:hypothetical protein
LPSTYIAQAGESPDAAARNLWGDERLFPRLVDANPAIRGVVFFSGGEVLTVPDLPAAQTVLTPPWED